MAVSNLTQELKKLPVLVKLAANHNDKVAWSFVFNVKNE